ncbi:MAG: hypothetical protein IJ737_03435 [Ruminococcus sp.]|nr:hypothetical protein [Ruminococcus sp.]
MIRSKFSGALCALCACVCLLGCPSASADAVSQPPEVSPTDSTSAVYLPKEEKNTKESDNTIYAFILSGGVVVTGVITLIAVRKKK